MADGGRKRKRFTPHNVILSPQRKKRYDNRRFYIGNAAEEWERQRCFYGESHAQFAAHLLAQQQSTRDLFGVSHSLACVSDSDSERNALSPIIQISDRLVTPGILCSLLTPRKVQRLL